MSSHLRVWLFALLPLVGCVESSSDLDLAEQEEVATDAGKADASGWQSAATLHAASPVFDRADAGARRVHSLWLAGSQASPLRMSVTVAAVPGYSVRVAVLGPLRSDGTRQVIVADGYSRSSSTATVSWQSMRTGDYQVIVGSYGLASETFYTVTAGCAGASCSANRLDTLTQPKDGALVGDASGLVAMRLGDVFANRTSDVAVEVWASPPMRWDATRVATSVASGSQVNAILPSSVQPGDDLQLVVRTPGGRILDTGSRVRYAPSQQPFARTDAVLLGDLTSVDVAGVVGYTEGVADLRLRSETRDEELAQYLAHADRPGMVGNGLNAFDANFVPDFSNAAYDGELLSVGWINGNGDYNRLGCFEYCNNASGMSTCTGGTRPCP